MRQRGIFAGSGHTDGDAFLNAGDAARVSVCDVGGEVNTCARGISVSP